MAKSMKTSRCKKIKAKPSPKKRGPKKSRCKKTMPKRRYKKRSQSKSMKKSPVRRRSAKKCMTGMRKSPPPKGYELICGRLVKTCPPGKMRNENGRCVDTPAVRIAKIVKRLEDEGKNVRDYDIDMNNYKVLRKLARNPEAVAEGEDKQAVWIKRDSCGRPVVNWKQKFLCGQWDINNYTKDGNNETNDELSNVKPVDMVGPTEEGMEWVWKTSGKCGWPEKAMVKDDNFRSGEPKKSGCNKPGKAKKNILPLEDLA
jgi:hypothetical protein